MAIQSVSVRRYRARSSAFWSLGLLWAVVLGCKDSDSAVDPTSESARGSTDAAATSTPTSGSKTSSGGTLGNITARDGGIGGSKTALSEASLGGQTPSSSHTESGSGGSGGSVAVAVGGTRSHRTTTTQGGAGGTPVEGTPATETSAVTGGTSAKPFPKSGSDTGGATTKSSGATLLIAGGTTASGGSGSGVQSQSPRCPNAAKTITVAADGSGEFRTVQAAINSISSTNSKQIEVHVKAGKYDEQVKIDRPFVCLTGDSPTSTIITHTIDTNIVTGGTVLLTGNDFSAADITFENNAPVESAQRVALMAKGVRQQFYNCRFLSYQDTLYTNTGTQYFKDCYIQGNTDFIFGDATAVFENCTIHSASQGTAVTAPRTPQGATYGFVFLGGSLTASSSAGTGRVHLGRPWGPYAAAAFINVSLASHIAAAGWTTMSNNTLANTRFAEYQSIGAGANTTNATRATRQLTDAQAANYTVKNVLSPWVPGYSQ